MKTSKEQRYSIEEFNERFPDDDACLEEIFKDRYGDMGSCPHCKKQTKFYRITGRKCYACEHCGHQLHPLADTIFHKSSTPLKTWFYAIFLFSSSKNGVAAKELERQLSVTYKTAWRMAKQIRLLFTDVDSKLPKLSGSVEVDETYIGGRAKGGASDFCVGRMNKIKEYEILQVCRTKNFTRGCSG